MATNNILNIPQWILTGSVSIPDAGFSKIYPKKGETSSWYIVDEANSEKRLALDYYIGAGLSQSLLDIDSKYGYRLDVLIGPGLTYASGPVQNSPISVAGLTPSMLSITGSFTTGYVLSTSTYSGEFAWVPFSNANIKGDINRVAKFGGPDSLTSSIITDTGLYVYIGSTPSNTSASFSVDGYVNIGKSNTSNSRLYFGDAQNHYIEKELDNGFVIRTEDEFRVDHYTNSATTYKVIDFDFLGNENRTLGLMNNLVQVVNYTSSSYISASNVNFVRFGKTQSSFQLELISGSQGAIKIQDGGQASYSVLYSDSQGIGKWGQIYGYNGLTTSALGIGLNLTNIAGLTYSGGTFGLDYTKFAAPISVSNTFTVSLATVSVTTGVTYGSMFETPTFRVDQWGRIIGVGTVSTMAFTGPQGPTGTSFVWQNVYARTSTYTPYDVVQYDGSSYISITTSNIGNTPSIATMSWNLMASKGVTGPQGITGPQGPTGTSGLELISATFGDMLVYGVNGWTAVSIGPSGSYLYSLGTESNLLPIWVTAAPGGVSQTIMATISQNFTVNLNPGKYFGRYNSGDIIESIGWTWEYFIFDVLNEGMKPIVTLNIDSPSSISYGETSLTFVLSYDYTIKNYLSDGTAATFSSGVLEWSLDQNDWNLLFSTQIPIEQLNGTSTPALPFTWNHTQDPYYDGLYYFRYAVTDTKGDTGFGYDQIDVTDYIGPTVTINVSAQVISDARGESQLLRELGNVASNVNGNATRNSVNIDLQTWVLAFRRNGTLNYTSIGSGSFLSAAGGNTTTITHDDNEPIGAEAPVTATSITYIHTATDEISVQTSSLPKTVNFEPLVYFGPVNNEDWISGVSGITREDLFDFATTANGGSNGPGASQNYRLKLESIGIDNNNKITFYTGVDARIFIVAVPSSYTILTAFTMDTIQGNILDKYNYFETINLKNYDGVSETEYKVFCHTQSVAYAPRPTPLTIEITFQ
jgi:hypothetical protein